MTQNLRHESTARLRIARLLLAVPRAAGASLLHNVRLLARSLRRDPLAVTLRKLEHRLGLHPRTNRQADVRPDIARLERKYHGITEPIAIETAYVLEQRLARIPVEVRESEPRRLNFLLPDLDPAITFGGYISCLQFIRALSERGQRIRIVLCEAPDFEPAAIIAHFASNPPLQHALATCEYVNATGKETPVTIGPHDSFVAYSFWTGMLAHHIAKAIGKRFVFFIQEYEPIFHPYDSFHAIGAHVYRLPHLAIFNTEILQDYFREQRLGVFRDDDAAGLAASCWYQHALTKSAPPRAEDLAARTMRRFLLYARPESHARRNLFEIAFLGLREAVARGYFSGMPWELHGIGTLNTETTLDLGHGYTLQLRRKLSHADYASALREFDAGMSLMYAPHPSLLPFEMASSGIATVTNTFGRRDAAFLRAISANLYPCEADIDSVATALGQAVAASSDIHERIAHSPIAWSTDWRDTFDDRFIARALTLLQEA